MDFAPIKNNNTMDIKNTSKVKPKSESKETVPVERKTSYTSESSLIDIESEPDSDASEKSIPSDLSVEFSRSLDFKNCLAEKLKSKHTNGSLFDQNLRNPYCYQLHTLETHRTTPTQTDPNPRVIRRQKIRPVAKQSTSTQTEMKTAVVKKTVSTQASGKKSCSTQTFNCKGQVGVGGPSRLKYIYARDVSDPWHGNERHNKYHKASKAVFDANDGVYIQDHPSDIAFGDGSSSEVNEDPSIRKIFGVPLKHVQTP